jgi:hypothetical protein
LREQAWTWVGSGQMAGPTQYEIPFTNREEPEANREAFESAWPHILSVKSKGAPLTLLRGPHAWVHVEPIDAPAGVRIVVEGDWAPGAEIPPGTATSIELVVDGAIVDLNRIPLPPDTPVIDRRFEDRRNALLPAGETAGPGRPGLRGVSALSVGARVAAIAVALLALGFLAWRAVASVRGTASASEASPSRSATSRPHVASQLRVQPAAAGPRGFDVQGRS